MSTREYQFIVGPETSALPAIGTPSETTDLITLGYADAHYTQGKASVADITALKAVGSSDRTNGMLVVVRSTKTAYIFDSASSDANDDNLVLQPSAGTGRWIKLRENQLTANVAVVTDANGYLVAVAGVSATELGYLSAVTSDIQGQLNAKVNLAGGNTISGVQAFTDTTESTTSADGAMTLLGGLGVAKNLNVGGDLVVTGNLTVNGTTTVLNTSTIQSEDTNIQINFGGNDATSEGAGLTIERTGTKGSFVYANALASRFKIGDLGSESEVMSVGSAQTVSGAKTHTGAITLQSTIAYAEETDAATTGSAASLPSPAKAIYRVTNASLVSLTNIADPVADKYFILVNGTGAQLTIINDAGGTAANRILTGTGADVQIPANASATIFYDNTSTRWRIVGGTGSSSSLIAITAGENLTAGDWFYIFTDGKAYKGDNTLDAKMEFAGFVQIGATTNNTAICQISGEITVATWSWATLGEPLYAGAAGASSQSAPNTLGYWFMQVGIVRSATKVLINSAASATAVKIGTDGVPAYTTGGVVFGTGTGSSVDATKFFWDNSSKKLALGHAVPVAKLDILRTSSWDILTGGTASADRADTTQKTSRYGTVHYTNSEESVLGLQIDSTATENILSYGGGTSAANTATSHVFYTAANNTTTTGTARLVIDSSGKIRQGAINTGAWLQAYDNATGASASEILSLNSTYTSSNALKTMVFRDATNIVASIGTRYDGTNMNLVLGSIYNTGLGYNSTERLVIQGDGRIKGSSAIHRILSTTQDTTSGTNQYIESGTFATSANGAYSNIDSVTYYLMQWIRVGQVVTCSLAIDIDTTATGGFFIRFKPPISSALGAVEQCGGVAMPGDGTGTAKVYADATNDGILLEGSTTVSTSRNWAVHFTYLIP